MLRLTLALAVGLALGLPARGADDDQKQLADVFAALKKKRDGAPRQQYKITFTIVFTQLKASEEHDFDIDWKTERFRSYTASPLLGTESHRSFNGQVLKNKFRDLGPDQKSDQNGAWRYALRTGRIGTGDTLNQARFHPVSYHHGTLALPDELLYPGHLGFAPDPKRFLFGGEVRWDDRTCLSIKTVPDKVRNPKQYEYIIDPKRDHSVVGLCYYVGTELRETTVLSTSFDKATGRWRLDGWGVHTITKNGFRANVISATCVHTPGGLADPTPADYDIVPPEGARVWRSHYALPRGKVEEVRDSYEYTVKNGKLVQTAGPNESELWYQRHGSAVAGIVARPVWCAVGRRY